MDMERSFAMMKTQFIKDSSRMESSTESELNISQPMLPWIFSISKITLMFNTEFGKIVHL